MRVLIVDDQLLFAEAMRTILEARGYRVVSIAVSGAEALATLTKESADVALVDVVLPDEDGIRLGRRILEMWPGMRVVALTGLSDRAVQKEAIASGLHGYVSKDVSFVQLVSSLEVVLGGRVIVSRPLRGTTPTGESPADARAKLAAAQLTRREHEVLKMLGEGDDVNSIGSTLAISSTTVKTHIQNILSKLQVHSRLEAVAFAARHRLIPSQGTVGAAGRG